MHILALVLVGTNDEINDTIRGSLRATESAFGLVLTGVQGIISFVIDTYQGLFLCFFQLIVRGGLALMIEATSSVCLLFFFLLFGFFTAPYDGSSLDQEIPCIRRTRHSRRRTNQH